MAGYWNGDRICGADRLFALSDVLDVDPRWLVTGERPTSASGLLLDAAEADWIVLDEYDLRELTDDTKGEPRNPTPLRRDWLNQTLGTASGLWLARLLSDYPAGGLVEGTLVLCTDIEPAELLEGQLCMFRVNGGLLIGRYSFRAAGAIGAAGDRVGEMVITSSQIGHEDNRYWPIARILGRFIGRL